MAHQKLTSWPPGVAEQLGWYVYRLIDPRNGETFYVGKGKGNRVFAHILANIEGDEEDIKLKRIHEIHLAGFEVAHVIHRHGLADEKTAFEVEAALIDAYPGLTNIVGGSGSSEFGVMHAQEIVAKYCAPEAVFKHKALLICVNRQALERSLYEAVRYAWRVNLKKVGQAEVVLPTLQGVIKGAFVVEKWLPATAANFPERWAEGDNSEGRFGSVGQMAPEEIRKQYVGKRVPADYRKRGAAYPVKYTWK
jgi:hypothetical protein